MLYQDYGSMNDIQKTEYLLAPGYIIVPDVPMLVYMILGSCVAVVINNRTVDTAGMCHFVKPSMPRNTSPRSVYGSAAIIALIRLLLKMGGTVDDLEAQVIGGSDLPGRTLGKENAEMAVKMLQKRGIYISSQDIGGDKGRKVIFNTENNNLAVIKVDKIRSEDWYPDEDEL